MRNATRLLILLFVGLATAGTTRAQMTLDEPAWSVGTGSAVFAAKAWQIDAGSTAWFQADNNTRGGDYNAATDHVVVISRTGGLNGIILDASNGTQVGTLDMTGVAGGIFALSEIAITSDGQIFGANLQVSTSDTAVMKIYRWADETAAPALVYQGPVVAGKRFGDGVGIDGSGSDVTFYLAGSGNNDNVAMLKWDGSAMTLDNVVVPQAGVHRARYGVAPVPGAGQAWVNSPGTDMRLALIDTATGSIVAEVPDAVVSVGNGDLDFFTMGGRSFVATGPDFLGASEFTIVDVTDPASPKKTAVSMPYNTNANGNATGFVTYDTKRGNLIVAASNNAIASYAVKWFEADNNTRGGAFNPSTGHVAVISRSGGLKGVLLNATTGVQVGSLNMAGIAGGIFPLNEIAITDDGQIFGANLQVSTSATAVMKVYRWADETAAPELVFEGPITEGRRFGDGVGVTGAGGDVTFFLAGSGNNDQIAVLKWNGGSMALDGTLVPQAGVHRARYGVAPVPGSNTAWINSPLGGLLALISTSTGDILAEVPDAVVDDGHGDLAYFTRKGRRYVVTGPDFNNGGRFSVVDVSNPNSAVVVAATGTYAAANGNGTGFVAYDAATDHVIVAGTNNAIQAFSLAALPESNEPAAFGPENWRIDAGSVDWFQADNNVRGGDYNARTDHVVVISRTGGLNGIILDAADGSEVGRLDVTGIAGGIFPLSEIAITEDGQIFGANLQVNTSDTAVIKIYRWADEAAVPELVFEGPIVPARRFGDGVGIEGVADDVLFYISGSGNETLAQLHWDGAAMTVSRLIVAEAGVQRARYGTAPIPGTGLAWINSALNELGLVATNGSVQMRDLRCYKFPGAATFGALNCYYTLNEQALQLSVPDATVSIGAGDLDYFEHNGRSYVATGPDFNQNGVFHIADVTDPADVAVVSTSAPFSTNPNGNGTGFVTYDSRRGSLIVLASNNALVSYSLAGGSSGITIDVEEQAVEVPDAFRLQGNYPNPFNPSTNIVFDLDHQAEVGVQVFDMLGREVLSLSPQWFAPGSGQQIRIDASGLTSGTYLYRVTARGNVATAYKTGTMVLLK